MCKRFFCILFAAVLCFLAAAPALTSNAALFGKPDVDLSVPNALLVNLNTGTEVFSVGVDEKVYPASTTKIMTAIVVLENCSDLEETVTVSSKATAIIKSKYDSYAKAGLETGDELSVRYLLELLMVKSACDAAIVLSEHVSGSEEDFAEAMNAKAEELGCTGTHFTNSTGKHSSEHYTTAYDMSVITQYALKNPTFVELFSMSKVLIPGSENSTYSTTNFLLLKSNKYFYKYATGGKTGTTTEAGRCLVSTAKKDDAEYLCLVFGGKSDNSKNLNYAFEDTIKLFDWAFDNLSVVKIGEMEGAQFETKLRYAWNHDYVTLSVEEDVYAVMPVGADTTISHDNKDGTATGLLVSVDIPDHLDAPVTKGDPAGTAKFFYRDEDGVVELANGSVVVYESVDRNFFSFIFTKIGSFFTSTPVVIILIVLLTALIIYLIICFIKRTRGNRRSPRFSRRKSAKTNYRRTFRR